MTRTILHAPLPVSFDHTLCLIEGGEIADDLSEVTCHHCIGLLLSRGLRASLGPVECLETPSA
jgi:hypothetical protein